MQSLAANMPTLSSLFAQISEEDKHRMHQAAIEHKQAQELKAYQERLKAANIPPLYMDADLAKCDPRFTTYANALKTGSVRWLLVKGKNGRGKTYASCAILLEIVKTKTVLYTSLQDLIDSYKGVLTNEVAERQLQVRYRQTDLLLLDDLGKEQATDWSLAKLFALIEWRMNHLKPTIITTNMNGELMIEHFAAKGDITMAESLVSRIGGKSMVDLVVLEGEDRRRQTWQR